MSVTLQARIEAYNRIVPDAATRRGIIYNLLKEQGPHTAEEIAEILHRKGIIPYADRNFVAPRLTEMRQSGVIETCGRRESKRSGVRITVWQVAE